MFSPFRIRPAYHPRGFERGQASIASHATVPSVSSLASIRDTIASHPAVVLYFTSPSCSVCHALKPKLLDAMGSTFDQIEIVSVDISVAPEIASQFGVFAVPTVLVFFDGKEFIRRTRTMRVEEVIDAMRRPYEILMS